VVEQSATPRLLYVGRLKRHKRVDLVIDLCARLREHVPNLVLDVIGTGDDEERLRALVAERRLEDLVHFHGFTSHARKVAAYSFAWALVTATQREGWGLSVIEAAACGTPALSLDVPGVRDAVEHGVSGWLAPNVESLYVAALRLLTDAEWRERLSHGALQRAQAFSWQASAARAREALVDAWLSRKMLPQRSRPDRVHRATLIFGRDQALEPIWDRAPDALQNHLRAGDSVNVRADEIHIEVALANHDELTGVEARIRLLLRGLSSPTRPEPVSSGAEL
jgi:hypothetical protein